MRTLDEIVSATRMGEPTTPEELRYAVVACDVLLAQLSLDVDPVRLAKYFEAAELPPIEYAGWDNDPENPDAVAWYRAMYELGSGVTQ